MEAVFLRILQMSLSAGVLVVAVLLLRLLFRKAPRWIHCLLWALVAVRLLCPFTVESDLSLMPDTTAAIAPLVSDSSSVPTHTQTDTQTDTQTPSVPADTLVVDGGAAAVVPSVPDSSASSMQAAPGDSVDPWQVALAVATQVWLLGVLAMTVYAVAVTLRLRRQVGEAAPLEGNIWLCDHIRSPFILGVFRPRIYLPSDLEGTPRDSVVAHERAHLRRGDHWWKPLGFLLLTVYWFNPLLWVAYVLLCRDIEAACDQRVIRDMSADDRRAYSEALLACSAPRRLISACPLAFGETGVRARIRSVLSYKKPTVWILVAALLASAVAGVCLLTDRPAAEPDPDAPPAVTEEENTATADLGLTYVARTGLDEEEFEQYFGSSGVQRLDSREELLAFLTPRQEGDQEWLGVQWEVSDFDQFDDTFFADNVLLLTHHTTSSGMFTPEVVGYTYSEEGTVLSVEYVEYHPGFATEDVGWWLMFSGVRRTDLEGVTELKSHFSKYIPTDTYVAAFTEPTERPDAAAERWRRWLPVDEGDALGWMMDEWNEANRWDESQSVNRSFLFATAFNHRGHTHYLSTDYSAFMRDDGALLWLTEEEGAFLRWIAAYYDEKNEDVLYLASSHPTASYRREYAATPVVLTSPEWKAIVNSDRWETVHDSVSAYGRFTVGGKVYYIDRPRERVAYTSDDLSELYAVYLTAEELAMVDAVLADTKWVHTDYMVGKVTQALAEDDCVIITLTDSSKYTSDISDGIEIYVSLRYYTGEMPAVGSTIRVTYDGYLGTYNDGEHYRTLIHAHTVTSQTDETWLDYTVTVKDQDGNPVPGVKISIASEMIADDITTDGKGVAKANLPEGVPTGTIEVPKGYVAASNTFTFSTGSTSLTIVLEDEQSVTSAKVTFVKFSAPMPSPNVNVYERVAKYMSPAQPDAATCDWLRQLVKRSGWITKSSFGGEFDAYFTIGEDDNYYYIDRVNQVIYHNRKFLPLNKEDVSKLDTLIRSYGIQLNSQVVCTMWDWTYVTGTVQEYVAGDNGYVLLKVDAQYTFRFGDTVRVSTRFIPRQSFASGSTVCVVYDDEPHAETTPFTIYAAAMNELRKDAIIATGVPQYDALLRQIQTYFYDRSATQPDCSAVIWDWRSLSDIGIKVMDLDKNGQNELFITRLDTNNSSFSFVYDMYTIESGKLVHVFSSTENINSNEHSCYYIEKGGYFYNDWHTWTGTAFASGKDYYQYKNGKLVFLERVIYDREYASALGFAGDDARFLTHTREYDTSTYEHITEEEANAIHQKYDDGDISFTFTCIPFSL